MADIAIQTKVSIYSDTDADLKALKTVAEAVTSTLGANGKIVHIYKSGFHRFTKDGITVLSELTQHKNKDITRVAGLIMQAAFAQVSEVGDGTTTTTLLTYEIYRKLLEIKQQSNISDRELKLWLNQNVNKVCDHIDANKLVCDENRIKQIAAVSANNDSGVGDIIGDLVWKVGKFGNILVERTEGAEITTELRDGYFFESPSRLPLNHQAIPMPNGKIELSDVWVLNTNVNFTTVLTLEPLFRLYQATVNQYRATRPLIVICEDLAQEAHGSVIASMQQSGFNEMPIIFVKAAYAQAERFDFLNDIQSIVGGQVWDNRTAAWSAVDTYLENGTFEIGKCDKFTFQNGKGATIYGKPNDEYVQELQGKYESEKNQNWKDFYGERLGKLTTGIGIIKIGASVEGEGSLRYDVVDDTWKACMSALKKGCVYGGGYALYQAYTNEVTKNDKFGLFREVLLSPFTKMTGNSQYPHEKGVFNTITQKWEHTKDTNILDPADAPITALLCAANVAFLLATKDFSIIHEIAE